jgi:hypothetical protein
VGSTRASRRRQSEPPALYALFDSRVGGVARWRGNGAHKLAASLLS